MGTMKVTIKVGKVESCSELPLEKDLVSQAKRMIDQNKRVLELNGALRPGDEDYLVTLGIEFPDASLAENPAAPVSRGKLVWDGEPGNSSAVWVDDPKGPIKMTRYPDFESFKNRASQNPAIATAGTPVKGNIFIHTKNGMVPLEMDDMGSSKIPQGEYLPKMNLVDPSELPTPGINETDIKLD